MVTSEQRQAMRNLINDANMQGKSVCIGIGSTVHKHCYVFDGDIIDVQGQVLDINMVCEYGAPWIV